MALTKALGGGSGSALTVKDEGVSLSAAVASIDFVGAGVTATGTTAVTVTIPTAVVLISENVLGGTAASVSFTSIAATYRDLRVVVRGRGDKAATFADVFMRVNNDSTAIYDYELTDANNTTISGSGNVAQTSWHVGWIAASTGASGQTGVCDTTIYDYRGTTFHKAYFSRGAIKTSTGAPAASNLFLRHHGGWYRSTSAITRVDVFPDTGNFIAGTVVSLYGLY